MLEALEPLYKGDVLELHDSEGTLTLGQEVRKGKTVSLRAAGIRCRAATYFTGRNVCIFWKHWRSSI